MTKIRAGQITSGAAGDGDVLTADGAGAVAWEAPTGGSALTVEEVDANPTDSAITKIVFPNGTLGIVSHVATYTPAAGSGITVSEEGNPLATLADTLDFVGAGVVASGVGATKTITIAGSAVDDILDLPTAEDDETLVLAPDGSGGKSVV